MAKIVKIKYFTQNKLDLINPKNLELYEKYLKSSILKNREVKETTFRFMKDLCNNS